MPPNYSLMYSRNWALVLCGIQKHIGERDSWILTLHLEWKEQRYCPKRKFRSWYYWYIEWTYVPSSSQLPAMNGTLAYFPLCTSARGLLWKSFPSTMGCQDRLPWYENKLGKRLIAAMSCVYGTARRHASRSLAPLQFVALTRPSKYFCLSKISGRRVREPDSYNAHLMSPQAGIWEAGIIPLYRQRTSHPGLRYRKGIEDRPKCFLRFLPSLPRKRLTFSTKMYKWCWISHCDLLGITSKRSDVLLYPLEGEPF